MDYSKDKYVSSTKAEELLGVKRSSLYSYVSRNKIKTKIDPKNKKKRLYSYEDIITLLERKNSFGAEKVAQNSLMWGEPVLESSITLINNNMLYYRGLSMTKLVKSYTFEQVASLIWTGDFNDATNYFTKEISSLNPISCSLIDLQQYLLQLEKKDLAPLVSSNLKELGAKILVSITQDLTNDYNIRTPIPDKLAHHFCKDKKYASELIKTSLIVIADHELNPSSFTARTVASTGANLFQVLVAGLSAMSGFKHGGAILRIELMINELRENMALDKNLRKRIARGDTIVGFGHNLYPQGDPRAKILLNKVAKYYSDSKEFLIFKAIMDKCIELTHQGPTIDFALLTMTSVLKVSSDFALFLIAYGRIVGWIGQAIEEYQENRLIRPRAKYIGKLPLD